MLSPDQLFRRGLKRQLRQAARLEKGHVNMLCVWLCVEKGWGKRAHRGRIKGSSTRCCHMHGDGVSRGGSADTQISERIKQRKGAWRGARARTWKEGDFKESARILCTALVLEGVAYLQERDGIVCGTKKREREKKSKLKLPSF